MNNKNIEKNTNNYSMVDEEYQTLLDMELNMKPEINYISHFILNKYQDSIDILIKFYIETNYDIEWNLIPHIITDINYLTDINSGKITRDQTEQEITIKLLNVTLYQSNNLYFTNELFEYEYIFMIDFDNVSYMRYYDLLNTGNELRLYITLIKKGEIVILLNSTELELNSNYETQVSINVPYDTKLLIIEKESNQKNPMIEIEYYREKKKYKQTCYSNIEYNLLEYSGDIIEVSILPVYEYYLSVLNKYNTIPFIDTIERLIYNNSIEQYNYIITSNRPKIIDISQDINFKNYSNMIEYIKKECYIFNIYNPYVQEKTTGYKFNTLLQQKLQNINSTPTQEILNKFNIRFPYNLCDINRSIWLNKLNNETKVHHDSNRNNFNIPIEGKKEWVFFKPTQLLEPREKYKLNYQWLKDDIEDIKKIIPAYIEIIINPGEMLFIPEYWYHSTKTIEDNSISINFWELTNFNNYTKKRISL